MKRTLINFDIRVHFLKIFEYNLKIFGPVLGLKSGFLKNSMEYVCVPRFGRRCAGRTRFKKAQFFRYRAI